MMMTHAFSSWKFWRGHTWIGWINLLVLQWFGCRLTRYVKMTKENGPAMPPLWVGIVWGITPGTGWGGPYRHFARERNLTLWPR